MGEYQPGSLHRHLGGGVEKDAPITEHENSEKPQNFRTGSRRWIKYVVAAIAAIGIAYFTRYPMQNIFADIGLSSTKVYYLKDLKTTIRYPKEMYLVTQGFTINQGVILANSKDCVASSAFNYEDCYMIFAGPRYESLLEQEKTKWYSLTESDIELSGRDAIKQHYGTTSFDGKEQVVTSILVPFLEDASETFYIGFTAVSSSERGDEASQMVERIASISSVPETFWQAEVLKTLLNSSQ